MSLSSDQIRAVFSDVREGRAALLLGQEYFRADGEYYASALQQLNIREETPSLNELWKSSPDPLGKALASAAERASYRPWLRAILSLGWNIILSSTPNNLWVKNSIGSNFSLNPRTQEDLSGTLDFYKYFNKKQPCYVALFGDEDSIPDKKKLLKMKNQTSLINMIYDQILMSWGKLVIDGLAEDDWFEITRLLNNIDSVPNGCIYVFGMDEGKAERACGDEDSWDLLRDCIGSGQIVLCEKSLKDIVTELGMDKDLSEDDDHGDEVRISQPNDDAIWIPRKECTRLRAMGITLMRDEILKPFHLNDDNKEKCFADFIQQRDMKNWSYFDIRYNKETISFHIPRDVEDKLRNAVNKQLRSPSNEREIILLKGNSNSGKTTSLSWYAWYAASIRDGAAKKKFGKHVVLFISGDPSNREKDWQDSLVKFIKSNVYDRQTTKNDRIRNVIVIWDNYTSTHKKEDYIELHNKLNECNAILIGSIYLFESVSVDSSVIQGNIFNELMPLHAKLEQKSQTAFDKLLKKIAPQWQIIHHNYLFETILAFAKYKFSPEWEKVKNAIKAGLYKEANSTEKVSNDLFTIFKDKNADDFKDVQKTVNSLGIAPVLQTNFLQVDEDKQKRNVPLINSIRDMNLILAVASQFKKKIQLPLSVLLRTISKGKQYNGDYNKLRRILRTDSMVEYGSDSENGTITVSFRHPSEAIAYLDSNYTTDRKKIEINVIIRLIENCQWDNYEEAKAVATFVRQFGTNSNGKYNDERNVPPGQFTDYSEHWKEIIETLNKCATGNAEAMLISGHFTRDHIETCGEESKIEVLNDALDRMNNAVNGCHLKATCSRLYGEICSNLLLQMRLYDDAGNNEMVNELSAEFEYNFKQAVKQGVDPSKTRSSVSTTLLLSIWLNYVIHIYNCQDDILPDTLEYIDMLFFNIPNLIDDNENYVTLIRNINSIFEIVNKKQKDELRALFANSGNDSYGFYLVKQVLIKLSLKYQELYPELFGSGNNDNNLNVLSGRIFFLNERAAEDFVHFRKLSTGKTIKNIFRDIKRDLEEASEEIVGILAVEFQSPNKISYRCLLMYLKAKWMRYTGNLMLEPDQYPALSNEQWLEINNICKLAAEKKEDNEIPRSLKFIQCIYSFMFEGGERKFHRYENDPLERLICLCKPEQKNGKGIPRLFHVSTRIDTSNNTKKLYADIDYEIVNGDKVIPSLAGHQKKKMDIFVPENIKNYDKIRTHNLNIDVDYEIWFNFGGALLQDSKPDQEV